MAACDFGVGTAANVCAAGIIGIFQQIKRYVRYVIVHKKNLKNFEEKMESLKATRVSVKERVDVAERNLERILADVQRWCQRVDQTIDKETTEVKDLEDEAKAKCFLGLCPNIKSRYQLSRKAEEYVTDVDQLLQQGRRFNNVSVRDVPVASNIAAPENYEAFDSRQKVFDQIVKALEDPTISRIGVYGTGGMGKTTLVQKVAKQVEEANLFCPAVLVEVTPTPNIEEIQRHIAELLGLNFVENNISTRASLLSKRLEKEQNILIVLDNIWDELNLEEVGIRFGDQQKGCKILLTSRNRDVLRNKMGAETFPINGLEEREAWDLFKKMAENDFEDPELLPVATEVANPELLTVATEVAKKCAGLPLAIVTVAKALKNKDLPAWREALRQLQTPSPVNNIPAPVYSAIRLSYDNLEYEELKRTFLQCCLLVHNSQIKELLRFAMGLHLFEGVNTVEATRDKVLTMVINLKDSCLLLDDYKNDSIAMHDFVRDVAIVIARDNHAFVLRHGDVFEEWPDEEKIQNFKMICLSFASIQELPSELECPQLTLFSMGTSEWRSYWEMPPGFFEKMKKMEVLNLIQADFLSSASSISFPTSLRTLCLKRCRLGDIVSLGELKNLEILSLSESNIERLPEETGQLRKLRSLDLTGCGELKIIPPGVLSSLSRLEELFMGAVIVGWNQEGNARLYELKELSRLTTLEICILDAEIVPEDIFSEKLQRYEIVIGVRWEWYEKFEKPRTIKLRVNTSIDHVDDGLKGLLKKTEALYLEDLKGIEIVSNQVSNRESTSVCQDELALFGEEMELPFLEDLKLDRIHAVGRIWHNQFLTLKSLTKLEIRNCGNLKDILSSSTAKSLVHLKSLEVRFCKRLREIIFSEDIEEDDKVAISFPQLRTLRLQFLKHFIGFCSDNYKIIFPSLKTLEIKYCSELKEFIYKSTIDSEQALFDEKMELPFLEDLDLFDVNAVGRIWHNQFSTLKSLAKLEIHCCNNLKDILSSFTAKSLTQLKSFHISRCKRLREIIFSEDIKEDDKVAISFPQLRTLRMQFLKHFIGFCSDNYKILFPSLKTLEICDCPELKEFIYKSTIDSEQTLFDEKMELPFLEDLKLDRIHAVGRIWHNQFLTLKSLATLNIYNCGNLKDILSSSTAKSLVQLKSLEVRFCKRLREIIFSEDIEEDDKVAISFPQLTTLTLSDLEHFIGFCSDNYKIIFPSLKRLRISDCPELKEFIYKSTIDSEQALFDEKVAFPQLEELRLTELKNCRKIWHDQLNGDSFSRLNDLSVQNCERLLNVFPFNMSEKLQNLTVFEVESCNLLEEIFEPQILDANETATSFVFSKLTSLHFNELPKLKSFYYKIHTTKWPSLKQMKLRGCDMVEIIFASESLSFGDLTNQQPLFWINEDTFPNLEELNLTRILRMAWRGQLRANVFSKLRVLELEDFFDISTDLLLPSVFFENLTTLKISRCHKIVNLIACSTVKSLVQLTEMSISDCEMIEEIIAGEDDEVKGDIVFARLKHLKLSYLPSLASFCLGKHNFDFLALEKVSVIGCPKMKIFSQGDLSTPMLQRVQFIENGDKGCWEGNLNDTIQWLFAEKIGFREIKKLSLSDSFKWIEIWRNYEEILCFKSLTYLEVHDCKTLRYLFRVCIALDLPQLYTLKVKNCIGMKHIILDEGLDEEVENKIVFPRLEAIRLECCADLTSFYQGSKILKCPSLKRLTIFDCPKMFVFASTFLRETIDDGGNTSSRLSSDAAFFDNKVEFPQLDELMINRLGNCRKIWHNHLIDDSFSNLIDFRVWNCDKLLNVFSLNMSHRLQNLMMFKVEKCDSLEEIFEPQVLKPELHTLTATESIVFARLEDLHLSYLPSLASFCSEKHNFEFPALKEMFVRECPKMKIFCKGDLSAPKLQKVTLTENEEVWRWEGNLKATIQRLFEEMNVQNAEEEDEDK